MPTTPAMAATVAMRQAPVARAVCQPPAALICDQASSSATGTMTQEIQRRTRSVPSWSSEPTLEKRRASRASRWGVGPLAHGGGAHEPLPRRDRGARQDPVAQGGDRKSTRLNSSHLCISYAVFCLKKKKNIKT